MSQLDLYNNVLNDDVFVKSPFNYIGGKYKLLSKLLPLFPKSINECVDVFGGGFNVGVNTESKHMVYNDYLTPLVELQEYFYNHEYEDIIAYIDNAISEYNLSKNNKDSFLVFRKYYNSKIDKCPLDLYVLMCYSFNYQLRYNNKYEYNSSHGTNRSSFNNNMRKRLERYILKLQSKSITFYNKGFTDLNYKNLTGDDFVYFDPPYILGTGNYNDGNRGFKNWTIKEEQELYGLLQELIDNDVCFGLNNLLMHKGETNTLLKEFIDYNQLNVVDMGTDYKYSNYRVKNKDTVTKELYVYR